MLATPAQTSTRPPSLPQTPGLAALVASASSAPANAPANTPGKAPAYAPANAPAAPRITLASPPGSLYVGGTFVAVVAIFFFVVTMLSLRNATEAHVFSMASSSALVLGSLLLLWIVWRDRGMMRSRQTIAIAGLLVTSLATAVIQISQDYFGFIRGQDFAERSDANKRLVGDFCGWVGKRLDPDAVVDEARVIGLESRLSDISGAVGRLQTSLSALPEIPDLSVVEAGIAELNASVGQIKGQGWAEGDSLGALKNNLAGVDTRVAELGGTVAGIESGIDGRFNEFGGTLESLTGSVEGLDTRFGDLSRNFAGFESGIDGRFNEFGGTISTLTGSVEGLDTRFGELGGTVTALGGRVTTVEERVALLSSQGGSQGQGQGGSQGQGQGGSQGQGQGGSQGQGQGGSQGQSQGGSQGQGQGGSQGQGQGGSQGQGQGGSQGQGQGGSQGQGQGGSQGQGQGGSQGQGASQGQAQGGSQSAQAAGRRVRQTRAGTEAAISRSIIPSEAETKAAEEVKAKLCTVGAEGSLQLASAAGPAESSSFLWLMISGGSFLAGFVWLMIRSRVPTMVPRREEVAAGDAGPGDAGAGAGAGPAVEQEEVRFTGSQLGQQLARFHNELLALYRMAKRNPDLNAARIPALRTLLMKDPTTQVSPLEAYERSEGSDAERAAAERDIMEQLRVIRPNHLALRAAARFQGILTNPRDFIGASVVAVTPPRTRAAQNV